jgi:hypothetical protein
MHTKTTFIVAVDVAVVGLKLNLIWERCKMSTLWKTMETNPKETDNKQKFSILNRIIWLKENKLIRHS